MDEYRSDEKINEDAYVLEERRFYLDLQRSKRDRTRAEFRERMLSKNTEFNKELTDDKQVQVANWEEIIETMGYTIVRNKLFQELHNFTIYHGSRTIPPMQPCLVKVFLAKDHKKIYNTKPVERLVKVILGLKNDRIVKLLGAIEVKQTEKIYFFEELTKMSLSCYFKANKQPLDPIRAKTWLCELASGVLYLHSHGFAHQKVSLDWCYVRSDGDGIKLGCPDALAEQVTYDLLKAVSKWSQDAPPTAKKNQYSSFEALYGDPKAYDSLAADVWALGVLLYFFVTLKFPFNNWKSKKEMSTEVQCKRWSFIGMMDTNPRLDEDTKVFLSKIFVSSPEARLTIHEVIVDPYLYKKGDDAPPPPPPPPPAPVPPANRTELEQEYEWAHSERLAQINNLKVLHDAYSERYRYKRFQPFLSQVNQHSLTTKEFEKTNYEEGMQNVRVQRTNLVYQANEAQLYEGSVADAECYVKVESLPLFNKKYHVADLTKHLMKCFELKHPDKFIQLIKCYTVQSKIYLFVNANKSMQRLSEKFHEEQPIDGALARAWTRQLIDSIHFLHCKGLALPYMDPEYIFIKNGSLIIGQTESLYSIFSFDESAGSKVTYPTKNSVKTPHSAPEAIYSEATFDPFTADVWTVAAIMYNLLFLRAPFEVKIKKVYLEQIEQKRWLHIFDKKYKLDNDFFSFFDSIFIENPEARPLTIELLFSSLLRHPSA